VIQRLLVANRGEIARRIMRTCRALGIETVAVFSDADGDAAFVHDADYAIPIGGSAPAASYLRIDAVVDAVRRSGADAVHPGYGFLAENGDLARAVVAAGAVWVGPDAAVIDAMGSKLEAKRLMAEAGVPLLPSQELAGLDGAALREAAAAVGYPLLVKASAGGGGRGMRVVASEAELEGAVVAARREAASAFGDDTVFAERYVSPSRHVEVQIVGDSSGRVIHLHERECSIQRRHQKIVEEAPSPSLTEEGRAALHATAVRAGEAIGYTNAGTVEFLLAPSGEFFFLEVNTRLQVEHPVTEAVLGVDLVAMQLTVASGEELPDQGSIGPVDGHAIEARLYAEDPTKDYQPSTGTVHRFEVPGGVRVDAALDASGDVSQFYDPMIAKVVAHAPTRDGAARMLAGALAHARVDGIRTNRELLVRTLRHPEFLAGRGDTAFLDRNPAAELGRPLVEGDLLARSLVAAALALQARRRDAAHLTPAVSSGFRNVGTLPQRVRLLVDGEEHEVAYRLHRGRLAAAAVDGDDLGAVHLWSATTESVDLSVDGVRTVLATEVDGDRVAVVGPAGTVFAVELPRFTDPEDRVAEGSLVATMPGKVVAVHAEVGQAVAAGDTLLVLEAMKMEMAVLATVAGTISSLPVTPGDTVAAGQVLAVVD
jgi:propionyl-CoA carboxylase alpha chain